MALGVTGQARKIGRRAFVVGLSLGAVAAALAACQQASPAAGPAAASDASGVGSRTAAGPSVTSSAATNDWQAAWNATVKAGQQEGKLALLTPPGDVYRQVADAFQQKYGINVEILAGNGQADLVQRITLERKAGQFAWDATMHSPSVVYGGLKLVGASDPLRPALILPEVLDDTKWMDGFDGGWADVDKSLVYSYVRATDWSIWINRSVIPESQLNKVDQLWDPQWKGKIGWLDPRTGGSGNGKARIFLLTKGEERLRTLMRDQQPVLSQDRRQIGDWLIRGQYPIALGTDAGVLTAYEQQGVDLKNIQPLIDDDPAATSVNAGTGAMSLMNRAPHPNAAKVFLNWLLSQEGQSVFAQRTGYNSRRLDVPVADPRTAPDPARKYVDLGLEQNYPSSLVTSQIAKEIFK